MAGTQSKTMDDLFGGVSRLNAMVMELRAGLVDEPTVRRMVEDLLPATRRGRAPDPDGPPEFDGRVCGLRGEERLRAVLETPAARVAPAIGRSAEAVRRFQAAADQLMLLTCVLGSDRGANPEALPPTELGFYAQQFQPALRAALDSATAAEGGSFVPKTLSAQTLERIGLELRVAALFDEIDMPRSPFEIAGWAVARGHTGKHVEQTADSGQTKITKVTPGSRKITLTAVKVAALVLLSTELDEESLVPVLGAIERELAEFAAADVDDTVINGDTAGSHQDADVTAADDPRKNFNGLRKLTLAGSKTDGGNAALTDSMLRTNCDKMGRYGARADQVAHIVGLAGFVQLLATGKVVTVERYGPAVRPLAGELGRVDGVPIIVSEHVREDLNALGVQDGVTTNRSVALTVNRRAIVLGRRSAVLERIVELFAESDQVGVQMAARVALEPTVPAATEPIVALTFNLST
jgi:hypothetical protein